MPTKGFASETITVSDESIGLSGNVFNGLWPASAIIYVKNEPILASFDGSNPTDDGVTLVAGTLFELTGEAQLELFRAIRAGSTDAELKVQYFQD